MCIAYDLLSAMVGGRISGTAGASAGDCLGVQ